jgi:predicted transcriptional regulator
MAFNPKFTITPKINKALVEIERVRGLKGVNQYATKKEKQSKYKDPP